MGRVIVSGGCRASLGVKASDLSVGTVVKLMEGGVATEFIVVNQGNPSVSLYDSSCDGTWLLRKDIYSIELWNNSEINIYKNSLIYNNLNDVSSGVLGKFDAKTQNIIKEVKIPYRDGMGSGGTDMNGNNGLISKLFLLSMYETGCLGDFPNTGVKLNWFISGDSTAAYSKRIAYKDGVANRWWTRDPTTTSTNIAYGLSEQGGSFGARVNGYYYGVRPALIIPSTSRFDRNTLLLKG